MRSRLTVNDRDISDLWYRVARDARAAADGHSALADAAIRAARYFRRLR